MAKSSALFNDRALKLYYAQVVNHYQNISKENQDIFSVYDELYQSTRNALEHMDGGLYGLPDDEKAKVYQALKAIFKTLPLYHKALDEVKNEVMSREPQLKLSRGAIFTNYQFNNPLLNDWLILHRLMDNYSNKDALAEVFKFHGEAKQAATIRKHFGGDNSFWANFSLSNILIVIGLLIPVINLLVMSLYLLNQMIDGIERVYHREGMLKVALQALAAVASAVVFTGFLFITPPGIVFLLFITFICYDLIDMLQDILLLNPLFGSMFPVDPLIEWISVMSGMIIGPITGASAGSYLANSIYDSVSSSIHKDSIDPEDPTRFGLTASETENLIQNNCDPIVVKCAIIAIRAEIAHKQDNNKPIPSYLNRQFGKGGEIQHLLQQVRGLRDGSITTLSVGDNYFDCKMQPTNSRFENAL